MGRWGHAMFEGDSDRDLVFEVEDSVGIDMHDHKDPTKQQEARSKLDAGLGEELMQKLRKEKRSMMSFFDPKYKALILAAYMMNCGAAISDHHRSWLKEIHPTIDGRSGYSWPLNDEGFRDPGKVQCMAALENYVNGVPRDMLGPSCYHCGKIAADNEGRQLKRCSDCEKQSRVAFYCDRECQKGDWKKHRKTICFKPKSNGMGVMMMNV